MKKLISAFLTLTLTLSLCACNSSVPTETDTTTKFISEGFTLSVPNEYADLLLVDTPTVPTPMEMFPLAPTPLANINGSIPNIIVRDVMRIGLSRAFAADRAA